MLEYQQIREMVAGLADGGELCLASIPLAELDLMRQWVLLAGDELGIELETEDRIGDAGMVHLDVWRKGDARSGIVVDAAPPR